MTATKKRPQLPIFSIILRALWVLVITGLIGAFGFFYLQREFLSPPVSDPTQVRRVLVEIPEKTSARQIAEDLERQGLIRTWWALYALARFTGKDRSFSAGEFELSNDMNVPQVLDRIVNGPTFKRRVLIREGTKVNEIAPLFEEAGIVSKHVLDAAFNDAALRTQLGLPPEATSFEGYLFPETYFFSRPITANSIITRLVNEGQKKWTKDWEAARTQLGLSKHEATTLASIIEKESGVVDEQPRIASVFYNRMALGMRLQSDPTVIYGVPNFDGNLTRLHLTTPTPYNTYVISGLPPGPIANPGTSSLQATLFPEKTSFLYFVADGTGRHIFSSSLAEHNQAVNKYQRGR